VLWSQRINTEVQLALLSTPLHGRFVREGDSDAGPSASSKLRWRSFGQSVAVFALLDAIVSDPRWTAGLDLLRGRRDLQRHDLPADARRPPPRWRRHQHLLRPPRGLAVHQVDLVPPTRPRTSAGPAVSVFPARGHRSGGCDKINDCAARRTFSSRRPGPTTGPLAGLWPTRLSSDAGCRNIEQPADRLAFHGQLLPLPSAAQHESADPVRRRRQRLSPIPPPGTTASAEQSLSL